MKNNRILYLIIGFLMLYEINALAISKKKPNKRKNPEENPNLFEGDMLLHPQSRGVLARGSSIAWPDGIVPYQIASGFQSSTEQFIVSTMRQMEDLLAVNNRKCIQFRPRTSSDSYYITIQNGNGCFSSVGRGAINDQRTVSLQDPGCIYAGIIMHELSHTLGFFHEQSRPDRDSFVRINYQNIQPGLESNFAKYDSATVDTQNVPYDYGSVMHYGTTAFSINGQPTIEPLQAGVTIGQRDSLSPLDKQEIQMFYKCSASSSINWNGNNWAPACDFLGNDLSNARVRAEDCGGKCASTSGCTHFTWTTYNGGTCWMKKGSVSKSDAISTNDQTMVCGVAQANQPGGTINWNGNNWALACDFLGNDLSNAQVRGEDCSGKCAATSGCTHFTWTTYNGGTCWMKKGSVTKNDAFSTNDQTMVCGVLSSQGRKKKTSLE